MSQNENWETAFCAAYNACYKQLYFMSLGLLHNEQDAEDLVQETLLKAYKGYKNLKEKAFFKTWIIKIWLNQSRRFYSKHRRDYPAKPYSETDGYREYNAQWDEKLTLLSHLNRLSDSHRQMIVLRYFSQLTVPEMARILRLPQGTVKSRLSRALHNLKILYEEES